MSSELPENAVTMQVDLGESRELVQILKPSEYLPRKYGRLTGHTHEENLNTVIDVYPRMERFRTFSNPEQNAFVSCLAASNISERRLERIYADKLSVPKERHAYNSKRGYLLLDYAVAFVTQFYPDYVYDRKFHDLERHEEKLRLAFLHIVKPLMIDDREELVDMLYEMKRHRTPEYVGNIFLGLPPKTRNNDHNEIIPETEQPDPQ